MTLYDIIYKILKKIKEHESPLLTGDYLFNELKEELDLAEFRFKFFLEDLDGLGYVKIKKENIGDWGQIEILPAGLSYVNQYIPNEHTDINYKNFWDFLEKLIIKNTEDLILSKQGAERHLETQLDILEKQKSLANRGLRNCWDFQEKQVVFARQEIYRIEKELEKRRILSMQTANNIGGQVINVHQVTQKVTIAQAPRAETIEDEWKNEAMAKGLRVGTIPYYNFINIRKAEQKDKEAEKQREKDFAFYILPDYNYSPTIEDFIEELTIQKRAVTANKYLLFLRETKKIYGNARHYYTVWGARRTNIDRGELYDKILNLINTEISNGIKTNPVKSTPKSFTKSKKLKPAKHKKDENANNPFDYSNKDNYVFDDKIEAFKGVENYMMGNEYITAKGTWSVEQNKLVALIHILFKLGYLRPSIKGKTDRKALNTYKRFFMSRYSIDISKAFQPTQFKMSKLKTYKADFHFIPEIDKL